MASPPVVSSWARGRDASVAADLAGGGERAAGPWSGRWSGLVPVASTDSAGTAIEATSLTTYSAHWGYNNREVAPVAVAIGPSNRFHPAPIDLGQVAVFQPGRLYDAGPVTPLVAGQNLTWHLSGRTGTAAAPATPVQPILGTVEDLGDGLKRVYFGYKNTHKQRVRVPFGTLNHFAHQENAGQPFSFASGEWLNLFSVDVPVEELAEWTLMGQTVSG